MVHDPVYEYFSNTFPPTLIKFIGLNFVTSVEVSLPGFVMGITLTFPLVRETAFPQALVYCVNK